MAHAASIQSGLLIENVTTVSTSSSKRLKAANVTFQGRGQTSAGAGSADIRIEVSNDNVNFVEVGQISLNLINTSVSTDGFAIDASWKFVRAKVVSIVGTGAFVDVLVGSK